MEERRISAGLLKRGKMDRRGQENLSEGGERNVAWGYGRSKG